MGRSIDLIAGARPNFMKIASIIDALRAAQTRGSTLRFRLIHTGQHYDRNMSGAFFEQLGIPEPDVNLEVGSGTAAEQTAGIMTRYEKLLLQSRSDACVVVGDVTSTMACAIVARKLGVYVGHVEAGIRSGDWSMPEEINRVVTDSITNWFFTTSETANANLIKSGAQSDQVFFVGNTMIDTLLKQLPRLRPPGFWAEAKLSTDPFFVLTLHRPANVDDTGKLKAMLEAVLSGAKERWVVFPVHPRTARILAKLDLCSDRLLAVEPLPYLEFNYLVKHAFAVITDSGGVTEESTVMGVPCLTLRDSTERPETISMGTNELVGTDPRNLHLHMERLFSGTWKKGSIPPLWDGRAGARIVGHLERLVASAY
jgi:UDP-N-acetylglucosamine 2-epimerase (non-hydrolysing)